MSDSRAPTPPRASMRFRRAAEYDARILATLIDVLADEGWAAFSARRVAQRAGVSQQAVQDRYPDRSAMARGAYLDGVHAALESAIEALLSAHGTLGARVDPDAACAAWRPFAVPDRTLRAGLELLLSVPFDEGARTAVDATLGRTVRGWIDHGPDAASRRLATQRAYLIGRALGLVLIGSILDLAAVDMLWTESAILGALAAPARAGRAEIGPLPYTLAKHRLAVDDPRHEALLNAVLRVVARLGFHDATVQAIAAEANSTKDVALSLYPSKLALFVAATRQRQVAAVAANRVWIEDASRRFGPGRGEAAYLRATMHPDLADDRNLRREELRLTMRDASLRDEFRRVLSSLLGPTPTEDPLRLGYVFGLMAPGEGLPLLLTLLAPDAWRLPFEVVVVAIGRELERLGDPFAAPD